MMQPGRAPGKLCLSSRRPAQPSSNGKGKFMHALYLSPVGYDVGLTSVALGLVRALGARGLKSALSNRWRNSATPAPGPSAPAISPPACFRLDTRRQSTLPAPNN